MMRFAKESNPIDAKDSLARELFESSQEALLELKLRKVRGDLKEFMSQVAENAFSEHPSTPTLCKAVKDILFQDVLSILRRTKDYRNRLRQFYSTVYNEEQLNELSRLRKLQDIDLELFDILKKLEQCGQ